MVEEGRDPGMCSESDASLVNDDGAEGDGGRRADAGRSSHAAGSGAPAARTGKRYSINGAALIFEPDDESEAVSGDNYPSVAAGGRRQYEWRMRDGGLRSI